MSCQTSWEILQCATELILCGLSTARHGAWPSGWSLVGLISHLWIVINWTQLGLGMGACVHFSQCWDSIWCRTHQDLCVLPQTLWVCLCLEGLAFCPPSILALNLLLPPLLKNSLSTEWRDMMETSHLGLSAPRSFTLCTLSSCRSLDFVPIYCNRMFLQWYPSKNWSISIAECHWESFC